MDERKGKLNVRYHVCGPATSAWHGLTILRMPQVREDVPSAGWTLSVHVDHHDGVIFLSNDPDACVSIWVDYCPWCGRRLDNLVEESAN